MDDEGTGDGLAADRRVETRVRKNGRKDRVIVEKSAAEGLPEGWIKELVITKKGRRIRRDPYFIDPKSGYIFQSFKDASRYVRTGVLGKHARKPKDNSHDEDDSGNGKTAPTSASMEKKYAENVLEKEKKINIYVRNSKRKSLPLSDENSENCKVSSRPSTVSSQVPDTEAGKKEEAKVPMDKKHLSCCESDITTAPAEQLVEKRVTRSQAKEKNNDKNVKLKRKSLYLSDENSANCFVSSKQSSVSSRIPEEEPVKKEETKDSTERKYISSSENDITTTQDEQLVERRVTRSQAKGKKNDDNRELKRKSELNDILARRASKRLAGIELEQTPELKTRTSARQEPAVEQSVEAVVKKHEEASFEVNSAPESCERTEMPLSQLVSEKCDGNSSSKPNAALNSGKKMEMPLVSETNDEAVDRKSEGHSRENLNGASSSKKKKEMPLVTRHTRHTVAAKSDEAADGKFEGASSPKPCASLGSCKQMEKTQPVSTFTFQSAVAMSGKTVGRESGGSLPLPKPNTLLDSQNQTEMPSRSNNGKHSSVGNNAILIRNEVEKDIASILPSGNLAVGQGDSSALTENKANNVSEPPALDSTLADLWKDPCIAFAIKTLTGESLDPPNNVELLTEPKMVNGGGNSRDEKRQVRVFPDLPENGNKKANENPGSSVALPETDIWKDPCIEFAIKTLTGAIPVGLDQTKDNSKSQQQPTSSASTPAPATEQSCDYLYQQYKLTHKTVPGGAFLPRQVGTSETLRVSRSLSKG